MVLVCIISRSAGTGKQKEHEGKLPLDVRFLFA